ncbi:hypothetical protein OAE08_03175 [Gammaproteobacteria bacterium]|mgnify:CR=1 FL=1|jgi:hypothetical protein|nr:hypothetical protein [Gammaproteobacteria bacterium]|tara:strand:- start:452 stop:1435 length:984 start_codon:yes stop_codon:yes gene_type:complete
MHKPIRFLTSLLLVAAAHNAVAQVPMKPWGKPSLQGNWDFATITPFQRPAAFSEQEFLSPDEVEEYEAAVQAGRAARATVEFDGEHDQSDLDVGYNTFYLDQGTSMSTTMRTSQLIYPENGRMPDMTNRGRETSGYFRALQSRSPQGPEDRNLYDRCILGFNAGPPMRSGAYNNMMKLVQTEDYIVIQTEMVNDHRVIPTDGDPALPNSMRLWKGDSRGEWEGDTFVVTTTNFTHLSRFSGTGENMVLTERFTRVNEDSLEYQWTVEDTEMFDDKFTSVVELTATDADLFEYACHEANYAMPLMLSGARKQEAQGIEDDTWLPSWSR